MEEHVSVQVCIRGLSLQRNLLSVHQLVCLNWVMAKAIVYSSEARRQPHALSPAIGRSVAQKYRNYTWLHQREHLRTLSNIHHSMIERLQRQNCTMCTIDQILGGADCSIAGTFLANRTAPVLTMSAPAQHAIRLENPKSGRRSGHHRCCSSDKGPEKFGTNVAARVRSTSGDEETLSLQRVRLRSFTILSLDPSPPSGKTTAAPTGRTAMGAR